MARRKVKTDTISVHFDRRALRRARNKVAGMGERAGNVRAAWEEFTTWFAHQNRLQFGSRGKRYGGKPWKELSPSTVAGKRSLGYMTDMMVRDSTLLRSVADRPMAVERLGPHDMVAGTDVKYAKYHHSAKPRKGKLPRRKLWDVKKIEREGALRSALRTWIVRGRAEVRARKEGR